MSGVNSNHDEALCSILTRAVRDKVEIVEIAEDGDEVVVRVKTMCGRKRIFDKYPAAEFGGLARRVLQLADMHEGGRNESKHGMMQVSLETGKKKKFVAFYVQKKSASEIALAPIWQSMS